VEKISLGDFSWRFISLLKDILIGFPSYILRFSKSFFLYIASVIPPTWFLELENIRLKLSAHEAAQRKTSTAPKNSSILAVLANERHSTPVSASFVDNKIRNNSMLSNETISYYDYDIEIPVKLPDLPDDLKVNFNSNSTSFPR